VDHPQLEGMSPRNIERPGLADWIVARDDRARVVSISSKDRSAIGMAAQAVGDVYWLGEQEGVFVTSAYYRSEYPQWVADFNRRVMPDLYADTEWASEVPAAAEALSRPDASRFERRGQHTVFPHRADDEAEDESPAALNVWRTEQTPYPDRAVVSLALEALDELELGRRGVVDFLGVSLSQTDRLGHLYGPGSREQLDNLLRVDAELERLLTGLDDRVGPGAWVLAFSADHGVLEIPEHLVEAGVPAGRLTRDDRAQLLERIEASLPGGPWAIAESIAALPFVAGAYTFEEVESEQPSDSFAVLYSRSHSRTRIVGLTARWGVYSRWRPNFLGWEGAIATHGSPNYYDRHVPLIFLGARIPSGVVDERAATVDVAPTLASLAGIPTPDDLDGRVLESVGGR
jgi:hypothetical protein